MMYTVTRRTREIGIRMALGARSGNVLGQVLRETGLLVLIGIGAGVPLAIGGAYLIRSMLFGVGLADPVVLGLAAGMLAIIAVVAGLCQRYVLRGSIRLLPCVTNESARSAAHIPRDRTSPSVQTQESWNRL